jgi:glycosyltransferase involved in cell wall biosynthesis
MGYETLKLKGEEKHCEKYQPYILSVGRLETRKNVINIIKAYNLLRKERRIKHKLLLAGKTGYGYEEIENEIRKSKYYPDDIIELGYVSDENLPSLYKNASLLLYPSLYEGFGFPILEAFTFEIPVVTSDRSGMAEIADGAALLVNPDKVFEIAAAMSQIINKPEIKKTLNLKAKKILLKYSWEQCAIETLAVLTEKK